MTALHPIAWPDLIIAVLLAEGLLYTLRAGLHFVSRRNQQAQVAQRLEEMRPAALDQYRIRSKESVNAPLG